MTRRGEESSIIIYGHYNYITETIYQIASALLPKINGPLKKDRMHGSTPWPWAPQPKKDQGSSQWNNWSPVSSKAEISELQGARDSPLPSWNHKCFIPTSAAHVLAFYFTLPKSDMKQKPDVCLCPQASTNDHTRILVPRGCDPFHQHQESRPLTSPYLWACTEYSFCSFQPVRFDDSVNCGLPGCFAFNQKFQNFLSEFKWTGLFWFVLTPIFRSTSGGGPFWPVGPIRLEFTVQFS